MMDLTKGKLEELFGPNTGGQMENNIRCKPQSKKWPKDKVMSTMHFGFFYPGEVKRVPINEFSRKLVDNGDFEFTSDPTNAVAIRQAVAEYQRAQSTGRAAVPATNTSSDNVKTDSKADQAKADQAKADQAKADQAKADQAKADQAKADQAKADQAKADQAKADQALTP